MSEFKVGDTVQYTGTKPALRGLSGKVVRLTSNYNGMPHVYVVAFGKAGAKWEVFPHELRSDVAPEAEYTGKSVNYYKVRIAKPTNPDAAPYDAECNDIIEALQMNYAEGNAFKALWRKAAARTLGLHKKGNNALYDAEKVEFFGARLVIQEQGK